MPALKSTAEFSFAKEHGYCSRSPRAALHRRALAELAAHCHGDARPDCPILEDLARLPPAEQ
jgi:hypothetical protein